MSYFVLPRCVLSYLSIDYSVVVSDILSESFRPYNIIYIYCLLYTSDAADE